MLADPPYGYGYTPNRFGSINNAVFKRNFGPEDRLIGDTGNLDFDPRPLMKYAQKQIWWGGNCYADKLPNQKSWLVWFKAGNNKTVDQGHAELAWSNLNFAIRGFNHRWCGMIKDSERTSKPVHPTQKPIAVMKWCLGFFDQADHILDPFMGSGTTGVACAHLGRKFTGIEIDPYYFEIACKRISDAYSPTDGLFAPRQEVML